MKTKFIDYYMNIAELTSKLSYAKRLQVGAVIVKDNQILATGYNGTPAGWDNNCEDKVWDKGSGGWLSPEEFEEQYPYKEYHPQAECEVHYGLKTKPEVLHAETNALMKVAKSTESSDNAVLFCTHAPCMECSKLIFQAGIKTVFYRDQYRDNSGVQFLKQGGVDVHQYSNSNI
jgi:dCMP deaminase